MVSHANSSLLTYKTLILTYTQTQKMISHTLNNNKTNTHPPIMAFRVTDLLNKKSANIVNWGLFGKKLYTVLRTTCSVERYNNKVYIFNRHNILYTHIFDS